MNKEDYEAIAEMIKRTIPELISRYGFDNQEENAKNLMAKRFADYFEKEALETARERCELIGVEFLGQADSEFDRKQFLKDCGVKE